MDILAIAGYISAIATIIGGGWKVLSTLVKISKQFDDFKDQLDENTRYIMKLALYEEELPLTDRLHAGETYLSMGGNGLGKKKYDELLKEAE